MILSKDPAYLKEECRIIRESTDKKIVVTSGGFDPLHIGHLRCIRQSAKLGDILCVIVNGDSFLLRKKGYVFMPWAERLEIIDGLAGVNIVIPWDGDTVEQPISYIHADLFTKGGDRNSPSMMAASELIACSNIGCQIVYGVGGDKIQSSSKLVEDFKRKTNVTS